MQPIIKIAKLCLRQLAKKQRSASRATRAAVAEPFGNVFQKVLSLERGTPSNPGDELRQIHAQLVSINATLIANGSEGCSRKLLEAIIKQTDQQYPLPIVVREKAKPTIRLKTTR